MMRQIRRAPGRIRNVVLDLDNTLISAVTREEFAKMDATRSAELTRELAWCEMDDDFVVFERPGVQPFLDYVFDNFNVAVWTAASKSYALYVIDNVVLNKYDDVDIVADTCHASGGDDEENARETRRRHNRHLWRPRRLNFILVDVHCQTSATMGRACHKDLAILRSIFRIKGFALDETIIIDDDEAVCAAQPDRCVRVKRFDVLSTTDDPTRDDELLTRVRQRLTDYLTTTPSDDRNAGVLRGRKDPSDAVDAAPTAPLRPSDDEEAASATEGAHVAEAPIGAARTPAEKPIER
jgi:hypothetical protein